VAVAGWQCVGWMGGGSAVILIGDNVLNIQCGGSGWGGSGVCGVSGFYHLSIHAMSIFLFHLHPFSLIFRSFFTHFRSFFIHFRSFFDHFSSKSVIFRKFPPKKKNSYSSGGKDTCQGDSGGPMFTKSGSSVLV
jgi:hypothetical protein